METSKVLIELLEQAIKTSNSEQTAVTSFLNLYLLKQIQEIDTTREAAKKLSEGLRKYKTAHANLKSALAAVDE